jgi:acyl-CoA reductase-like NAD-dependent aldehyde dehydrogenase
MTAIRPKTGASSITVRNPAYGRVVGAGSISVETFDAVAAKARELPRFQPEWEALGLPCRKHCLLTYQEWVLDNAEHITGVVESQIGKIRADVSFEPPCVANLLDYWAGHAQRFLADEYPRSFNPFAVTKKLTTAYRPYRRRGCARD